MICCSIKFLFSIVLVLLVSAAAAAGSSSSSSSSSSTRFARGLPTWTLSSSSSSSSSSSQHRLFGISTIPLNMATVDHHQRRPSQHRFCPRRFMSSFGVALFPRGGGLFGNSDAYVE
jgi:hypothetical protein